MRKRECIQERHLEHKKLYMLFSNMTGLHRKIYVLNLTDNNSWWDKSGNFGVSCYNEKDYNKQSSYFGFTKHQEVIRYITEDKKDAEEVYEFWSTIIENVKSRI